MHSSRIKKFKRSVINLILTIVSIQLALILPVLPGFGNITRTVEAGSLISTTLTPNQDVFISYYTPIGNRNVLSVGNYQDISASIDWRNSKSFLRFSKGALPANAIIVEAKLKLHHFASQVNSSVRIGRPAISWNESTNYQYTNTDGTATANYGSFNLNAGNYTSTLPVVSRSLNQSGINHVNNSFSNQGFVDLALYPNASDSQTRSTFCSGTGGYGLCANGSHPPKLEIKYIVNQPPYTPQPVLPQNQKGFGGNCDESVTPATGVCRTKQTISFNVTGVGDGDTAPGEHKYIYTRGSNLTTGSTFERRQEHHLANGNTGTITENIPLEDGLYDWYARSIDNLNLWGQGSVHHYFITDTTPPEVPVLNEMPEFTAGVGIDSTSQFEPTAVAKVSDNISEQDKIDYIIQYSKDSNFESEVFEKPGQRFTETDVRFELGPKGIDEIEGTEDDITEDATYYFRTKARDNLNNTSAWSNVVSSTIDSTKPIATNVNLDPTRISPQNDSSIGEFDEITFSYNFTEEHTKKYGFEILNNEYSSLYSFTQEPSQIDNTDIFAEFTWNGLTEAGEVVADGEYLIRPIVEDLAGNSIEIKDSEHQRIFVVDNSGIEINFNQQQDLWVNELVDLTGQLNDTGDLESFEVKGNGHSDWVEYNSANNLGYDESLDIFTWDIGLEEGLNTFNFKTRDIVGNKNEYERRVHLDQIAPQVSTFELIHNETGIVEDLDVNIAEELSTNSDSPEIRFRVTDEAGIQIGNNPPNVNIKMQYLRWNREAQVTEAIDVSLFDSGVNLNTEITSDLVCSALSEINTKNGVDTASDVECSFSFKELSDTEYTLGINVKDISGNSADELVSRRFNIDSTVYLEIRSPYDGGIYSTSKVDFVGFTSKNAELKITNDELNSSINFLVVESTVLTDNELSVTCGTFINHDNDTETPDEEVCRWELKLDQYFDLDQTTTENNNHITVSDSSGNTVTQLLQTQVDVERFEIFISPNWTYLSPNGDGKQDDITFIHGVYNPDDPYNKPQISNYKLQISNEGGDVVKEFTGSGNLPSFTYWDLQIPVEGPDSYPESYLNLADGDYTYTLSVTSTDGITRTTGEQMFFVNSELEDQVVISTPNDGTVTTNGVVTIQGQAPRSNDDENQFLQGQVYSVICVDTYVPEGMAVPDYYVEEGTLPESYPQVNYGQGNNVECDHWQEVLVDDNGFFTTIIILPDIEGLDQTEHNIKAYAHDDYGNSTPYSNEVNITLDKVDPFIEVSLNPTLTGITDPADYEKFLNGEIGIDQIRALKIKSVVTENTEQVELSFADHSSVNERPNSPFYNYIATLTNETEIDVNLNPFGSENIKKNWNKSLGDQTIPYNNCEKDQGCVWEYQLPLSEEYGGIYEINFKGKKGTVIQEMTRGFQVDGRIPPAPVFMIVEKWDSTNETWVKMENINFDNFTDTGKIRFRGAAEPGTKVELWAQLNPGGEGEPQEVKLVDLIVGNTGVWEFIIDLEEFLADGGTLDGLPGGPGSGDGETCEGLDCLTSQLGFFLRGYEVDEFGEPIQVDENGDPVVVESDETLTVNYDQRAPRPTEIIRSTSERSIPGWARTGDQAVFNITVDEPLLTGEIIKEDGFVRLLNKLGGDENSELWNEVINVDSPEEGIYNVGIRLKDIAENTRRYNAQNYEQYRVDDFRLFIDNTIPDPTSISKEGWSDIWEQGGVKSTENSVEVGRTNPAYVTRSNTLELKGRAEANQRIEIFVVEPTDSILAELEGDSTPSPISDLGALIIDTIEVSDENCVAYDFDKVTSDGLTTKYNSLCDWNYSYEFPDDGANNWDGVPYNGYVFQARVIDKAVNESEWSNTVIVYHDLQAPEAPFFVDAKSDSYSGNIPGFESGQNTIPEGEGPITKDLNVSIRSNAERYSDLELYGFNSKDEQFHTDFFINPANRMFTHDLQLGNQGDQRDGCMTMNGNRRVGICEDGNYIFTSRSTDAVGQTSEFGQIAVERDTVAPAKPAVSVNMQGLYNINMSVSGESDANSTVGKLNENGTGSGTVMTLDLYNDSHWERWFTFCSTQTDRAGNVSEQACDSVFTPIRPTRPGECDERPGMRQKGIDVMNGNTTIDESTNIFYEMGFSKSCITYELDKLQGFLDEVKADFQSRVEDTQSCINGYTEPQDGSDAKSAEEAFELCGAGNVLGESAKDSYKLIDSANGSTSCLTNRLTEGWYYLDALNDCGVSEYISGDDYNALVQQLCIQHEVIDNRKLSHEAAGDCGADVSDQELIDSLGIYSESDLAIQESRDYDALPWHKKFTKSVENGVNDFVTGIGDLVESVGNFIGDTINNVANFIGNTVEAGFSLMNNAAAGLAALTESALTGNDLGETFAKNQQALRDAGLPVNDPLEDFAQIGAAVTVTAAIAATIAVAVVAAPLVLPAATAVGSALASTAAGAFGAVSGGIAGVLGGGAVATGVATAITAGIGAVMVDMGMNAAVAGYVSVTTGTDFGTNFVNVTCGDSVPEYSDVDLASCTGYVLGGSLTGAAVEGAVLGVPKLVDASKALTRATKYADELADLGKVVDTNILKNINLPSGLNWADLPAAQVDNLIDAAGTGAKVDISKISNFDNVLDNLAGLNKTQVDKYMTVVSKGFEDIPISTIDNIQVDDISKLANLTTDQTKRLTDLADISDEVVDISKATFAGDNVLKYGDEIYAATPDGITTKLDDLDDISHISDELLNGKINFNCVVGAVAEAKPDNSFFGKVKGIFIKKVSAAGECNAKQLSDNWFRVNGKDIDVRNLDHLQSDEFLTGFNKLEDMDNFLGTLTKIDYPDRLDLLNDWMNTNVNHQIHHVMTNKGATYASDMKIYADYYGLDLDGDWNKISISHSGSHPAAYHDWILNEMEDIIIQAGDDQSIFIDLFNKRIKTPVINNPSLLRKEPWKWDLDITTIL